MPKSRKKPYRFDEEKCEFVPIVQNRLDNFVHTACSWILGALLLTGSGLTLLAGHTGTPAELALRAENEILLERMKSVESSVQSMSATMNEIAETDNEMYRAVLGLDPLSSDVRQAGTGGSDPIQDLDVYREETYSLLSQTDRGLNNLERQINMQQNSFLEIGRNHRQLRDFMSYLPVIRPVNGIILSGYGMRLHPVLNYRRMHEGVDFRANVGTPVYTTGDGTIRRASRYGNYGLVVIIEHQNGYESWYAHLSRFTEGIEPGQKVYRGDQIGYSGNTGLTEGPHLHYEVRVDGEPVNPENYFIAGTTPEEYLLYQDEDGELIPLSME